MQKFILFICLCHAISAYDLPSILMSSDLKIGKKYHSQDDKNWLSIEKVYDMIYSSKDQTIDVRFIYKYSKSEWDFEELGYVRAEVRII
jgi:hypothetical protein